ncbi:dihydrodipicolinate synthase family protein [Parasedimentitalea maritima]|uniref:Dihydrodipicolinate synthase family protein n=1 Tax=Parasedimentitalea maritima TaxID=2578117 RepID=A0ABY2UU02_9RHOB|nr:dihydrodipicolinate synthase family protein [Zongyanglinia marina]TLP62767.1 dihydrodipicolinate synthase family protein [Zongyanglinia marina]
MPHIQPPESSIFGLSAALVSPFDSNGNADLAKTAQHAKTVVENGCDGVTLFGTTGEGYGFSLPERRAILTAVAEALPDGAQIHAGVLNPSIDDAVGFAQAAYEDGAGGLLLAPPFFMKDVDEDGLFNWFGTVFEKIGSPLRNVILYHIPAQTAVPLSVSLVSRLRAAYPDVVTGIKDSSGDWATTKRFLTAHGDIAVLVGDERLLPKAMSHGAQGSICGTANFIPDLLRRIIHEGGDGKLVSEIVEAVVALPVTAAVKTLTAHVNRDATFVQIRPPLSPLSAPQRQALIGSFEALRITA